jgi:hypothetical protein
MSILTLAALGAGALITVIALVFIIRKYIIGKDSYKPELAIAVESSEDEYCGIKLFNKGTGTAVIKNVDFWEEGINSRHTIKKSIDELFPYDKTFWMNNQSYQEERDYYLGGGDSLYFGKVHKDKVTGRGKNYDQIREDFDQRVKDIRIRIEYNDVYEKPQKTLVYKHIY